MGSWAGSLAPPSGGPDRAAVARDQRGRVAAVRQAELAPQLQASLHIGRVGKLVDPHGTDGRVVVVDRQRLADSSLTADERLAAKQRPQRRQVALGLARKR